MAIKENALPVSQSIGSGDYLRKVSSGGVSQQVPFSEVKDAVVTIDPAIDSESENPVQNKAIAAALDAAGTQTKQDIAAAIQTEVTNRNSAISQAISTEVSNRNQAIASAIQTETADRNAAIEEAIADEVTDRNAAIESAIDDEETARNTAISEAVAAEAQAREAADEELNQSKADTDGNYPDMTVGNADQLISSIYIEDQTPYNFRQSGGGLSIGDREIDKIVGGTVAWNQLVGSGAMSVTVQSGHKYYANVNSIASIGQSNGTAITINDSTKDNVIDLTQMFGTTIAAYIYSLEQANAGAGVAWFKKYFPKPYYEYNAGELISVEGLESHDTVGFNQWDGTFSETDKELSSTGAETTNSAWNISDYIRVVANTAYCFTNLNTTATSACIAWYDSEKNFISATAISSAMFTATSPTNAMYARASILKANAETACINLSWSGYRNGEYEPYEKHSYPLDNSLTLRGIPKLDSSNNLYYDGDEYASDGSVTRRYGTVELGSLTWQASTNSGRAYWLAFLPSNATGINQNLWVTNGEWKYEMYAIPSKTFTAGVFTGDYQNVFFRDDGTYTDATAFKTAMSGVYLVYELATPTTETATPYTNPQTVSDWGTEEYVDAAVQEGDRDVAVPVGHVTDYLANLRDKLQNLPDAAGADGTYLVQQTSGQMALLAYTPGASIPAAPTTDGTYTLQAVVSGGVATYSWVSS